MRVDTDSLLEAAERQQEQQDTVDTAAVPDTAAAGQDTALEDTVPVPYLVSTAVDSLVFLVPYQSVWCGCCDECQYSNFTEPAGDPYNNTKITEVTK